MLNILNIDIKSIFETRSYLNYLESIIVDSSKHPLNLVDDNSVLYNKVKTIKINNSDVNSLSEYFIFDYNLNEIYSISHPENYIFGFYGGLFFIIGIVGILRNKQNVFILLIYLELMLLGVSLNFIFFALMYANPLGFAYAILMICIAAGEAVLGLALIVGLYRSEVKISSYLFYLEKIYKK